MRATLSACLLIPCAALATDARPFLASITPSCELEERLVRDLAELREPELDGARIRIALLDLSDPAAPRSADIDGESPVYPASVVKFVYLMAAYRWQEEGRLVIEGVPGDTATTVVMGGSGTEDVMVLPTGLRIANAATSRASYAVRLPTRLTHVVVRIGGRPERTFVPGGAPLEIDLRGP